MKSGIPHRLRYALSAAVAGLCLCGCVEILPSFEANREFEDSAPADGISTLQLDSRNGRIRILVSASEDDVRISGELRAFADSPEAAEASLDLIEVVVSNPSPTMIRIDLQAPDDDILHRYGANLQIMLPHGMDLDIQSFEGNVFVEGNEGETRIDASRGLISVTGQIGDVAIDAADGNVEVESVDGSVNVEAVAGDVAVVAWPPDAGEVLVHVTSGAANVQVPRDMEAAMNMFSSIAQLDVNLDGFRVSDLDISDFRIRGDLNGGGGRLEIEVVGGSVVFAGFDSSTPDP